MSVAEYAGGCHCGAIRFTASIDLAAPTIRCNCSICTKSRTWIAPIPAANFSLDAEAEALAEYRFGAAQITHCFCRHCGVKTHGRINGESDGRELVAVSVHCLDITPLALGAVPRMSIDGRADRQDREPEVADYL